MARIDKDAIREATRTLKEYQRGKANLDKRIQDNEEWFRLQHWKTMRAAGKRTQTGHLHASIVNKHADFMDNMPECTVLPREPRDQKTAEALTAIIPVILERGGWPITYDKCTYDKVKFGGGIYAVLWDQKMDNGLGNIVVRRAEAMNIYWEPGVEDIQMSKNLFMLELIDHDKLREMFPNIKDLERLGPPSITMSRYVRQENVNESDKSTVVNWYYKRDGVLHYCRYVEDVILFASENEEGYENGWYTDGRYPYVFDPMFFEPESPYGFGLIDTGRDTQEDIDELNDALMKNAKIAARRRWFIRQNAKINEAEFADLNVDLVHVAGTLDEQSLREIPSELLGGVYVGVLQNKIDELKENTFNRDVNAGGSGGSQTAAGIAALQESGSKSSRAAIQGTYRAFQAVVNMVIERIRQFYDTPRMFRILGQDRSIKFTTFDNSGMKGIPIEGIEEDFGSAEPVFDLDVRVSKMNAWSRQAQNQDVINFYGMGFFNPQMSTQALACLEVLDLDNKDKLTETIKQNGMKEQFAQQFLPILIQAASAADPQMAAAAMQAAQAAGLMEAPQQQALPGGAAGAQPAETDVNGGIRQANGYMDRQRQIAAARTAPQG